MYSPDQVRPHLVGEGRSGGILVLAVIGLLLLFSGGFVGRIVDVGYSPSWIGVAFAIAIAAGAMKAGLVPTIGSLWLFALWWFIFPPLVGYLTGDWETSSRYTYPPDAGIRVRIRIPRVEGRDRTRR